MHSDVMKKISLVLGISIMGLLINIDYTAVNLALVTISNELHSNLETIQWILSGYVLAWAAIVIPAGKWSDLFSQRSVCVVGLCLFMASSVFAGISTSAWMLIASRVLQGISGAIFVPTLYALIFSNFDEKNRGTAIGLFSLGVGLGAASGPSFGGLILKTMGWSWIFYINVPLTLLAMACILLATKQEPKKQNQNKNLLQSNALILGLATVILMVAINQLNNVSIYSYKNISLFGCFAALLLFFIVKEKKDKNPTIPRQLLLNQQYRGVTLAFAVEQFCFSSSYVALGLFFQNSLHYSPYYSSLVFMALSCIFALISAFSGVIVDKVGINRPAFVGFVLLIIGCYDFLLLPETPMMGQLIGMLVLLGTGMGLAFSALNTGMMSTVKQEDIGIASSVFVMCALVGNALGVVIATLIILSYNVTAAFYLTTIMSVVGAILMIRLMRLKILMPAQQQEL